MTSEFIKKLNYDIKKQAKINRTPSLYIKQRGISYYKFKKSIIHLTEDDLPIQTLLGSAFLIKGSNIIKCYCLWEYKRSMYIQINKKVTMWIGRITIINTEPDDPEHIEYILDGYDILYDSDNYQYLILQFIQAGFKLYI